MQYRIQVINYGDAESLESLGVDLNECTGILLGGNHSIDVIQSERFIASGIVNAEHGKQDYIYSFKVGDSFKVNGVTHQLEDIAFPIVRLTSSEGSGPYPLISLIAGMLKEDVF